MQLLICQQLIELIDVCLCGSLIPGLIDSSIDQPVGTADLSAAAAADELNLLMEGRVICMINCC